MKKTNLLTLSLAVIATMSFAGCSNSGTSASTSSSGTRTLRIGLECDYAPFNWTTSTASEHTLPIANSAGNYADGYDINFAKMLGEQLGYNIEIYKLTWDSLIVNLNSNVIDCIIAGMTDTAERRQAISFTDEYYRSELVFVTSAEVANTYANQTLSNEQASTVFGGKNLVSQISTVTDDVLDTFVTNYGSKHLTPLDTFALAANAVSTGAAFAMSSELPVAQAIVASNSNLGIVHIDQSILGVDLSDLGVSVGIRKDDTELQNAINSVLATYTSEQRATDMAAANSRAE